MPSNYLTPGADIEAIIDAPPTPLFRPSPCKRYVMLVRYTLTPPLEMLAQPFAKLGGLRVDLSSGSTRRTYNLIGFELHDLQEGGDVTQIDLPPGCRRLSSLSWSPSGAYIAFTGVVDDGLGCWIYDVATHTAREVQGILVNDVMGADFRWMPDGESLLIGAVPEGRGPRPEKPIVPSEPKIQVTSGRKAKNRTYQDLLQDEHDDALLEHFGQTQFVIASARDASWRALGDPGLFTFCAPSPSGEFFLVKRLRRPFSRVVPLYFFAHTLEIWGADAELVRVIADQELAEEVPTQGVRTGPRRIGWRPLCDASLYWAEALDGGDPTVEAEHRDRLMSLDAPFDAEPEEFVRVEHRYRGISWLQNPGQALVTQYDRDRRWISTALHHVERADEPKVLFERSVHDQYNDPGQPVQKRLPDNTIVTLCDGDAIFLSGQGAGPEGDRPFLDRFELGTSETTRLFECAEDRYEFVCALGSPDADGALSLFIQSESRTEPPNYFLRDADGTSRRLTNFQDPHPELTGVEKEILRYEREDGVPLSGTLYLPPKHLRPEGPLGTVIWAYPIEYSDPSTAGQVRAQPTRFTRLSLTSPLMFLARGYAVLDRATMPVIGDPETMNDTFVEQIVGAAQGAVDAVVARGVADPDRICIAGHSYGAFMTANLLARTKLFRAGIARSGAYNRSLTPFGFQAERRSLWEAPETYITASPFFHADQIDAPLLLIHGEDDPNSGTFPLQSRRLFHAMQGLGGTARLVVLPHEGHGYRARESVLHVLAEQFNWLSEHMSPRDKGDADELIDS